jgi:hypothetical protein
VMVEMHTHMVHMAVMQLVDSRAMDRVAYHSIDSLRAYHNHVAVVASHSYNHLQRRPYVALGRRCYDHWSFLCPPMFCDYDVSECQQIWTVSAHRHLGHRQYHDHCCYYHDVHQYDVDGAAVAASFALIVNLQVYLMLMYAIHGYSC